jgi:hypothetical protein
MKFLSKRKIRPKKLKVALNKYIICVIILTVVVVVAAVLVAAAAIFVRIHTVNPTILKLQTHIFMLLLRY